MGKEISCHSQQKAQDSSVNYCIYIPNINKNGIFENPKIKIKIQKTSIHTIHVNITNN